MQELKQTQAHYTERVRGLNELVESKDAELALMCREAAGLKEKYASAISSLEQLAEAKRNEHARIIDEQKTESENLRNIIEQLESKATVESEDIVRGGAAEAPELFPEVQPEAIKVEEPEVYPVQEHSRESHTGPKAAVDEDGSTTEAAVAEEQRADETAGRIRCKICGEIAVNTDAFAMHFKTCHESDVNGYFPHLDYLELREIYPNLPREIYKCAHCDYFVSSLDAPNSRTSAIERHIETECRGGSRYISFSIVYEPDEIRNNYNKIKLPHHYKCRVCGASFKEIDKRQMVTHLAETHAALFSEPYDGIENDAAAEDEQRGDGEVTTAVPLWDELQRRVIESTADRRLVVQAGPGTGKTAVACERVAWLASHERIEPGQIWLISFTRTAVREIRDRIASCLGDAEAAHAVKIATIDSHAWAIHSGFDESARLHGYEDNIERMTSLVRAHAGVAEYLDQVKHLIVDEAQDVVGSRATLIIEIIRKLNPSCGVTVFTDDAQAIYGFTREDDTEGHAGSGNSLCGALLHNDVFRFEEAELEAIYRTKAPGLIKIFTDTRRKVLDGAGGSSCEHLEEVKKEIAAFADSSVGAGGLSWDELAAHDNCFVLYRRRADVLLASDFMGCRPHRIRMSGYPACILPWVGACLAEHTQPQLTKGAFAAFWRQNVENTPAMTVDMDTAWRQLVRVAGQTDAVIDMPSLRQRLGRGKPPLEFCSAELGAGGPIFGTIHASKGREADAVYLMMPAYAGRNTDHGEEARVVFVGATRARNMLTVGKGFTEFSRKVWSTGRAFSIRQRRNAPTAAVEIGRDGDIDAEGLAGTIYFPGPDDIRESQKRIRNLSGTIVEAYADIAHLNDGSFYRLKEKDGDTVLAALTGNVRHDLGQVLKSMRRPKGAKRMPPRELPHLRIFGARTVVLAPDKLASERLHEPWASSGIMLAPVVLGYSPVRYP